MNETPNSAFPCPCGRMQRNECMGECAKVGACVECSAAVIGHINGIGFCQQHCDAVMGRVIQPAKILLKRLMDREG